MYLHTQSARRLTACVSLLACRYALGFTSPIGDELQDDLNLTDSQYSLFSAIVNIGAMFGALIAGFLADKLGRRMYVLHIRHPDQQIKLSVLVVLVSLVFVVFVRSRECGSSQCSFFVFLLVMT